MAKQTSTGNSKKWIESKQLLEEHAATHGFKVKYRVNHEANSWISFAQKEIVIHSRSSHENQVYDLIHELGHLKLQQETGHHSTYYQTQYTQVFEMFSKSSRAYKIKILEEEVDAWKFGLILACELGIVVNEKNYEIRKASKLMTYASWASSKKRKPPM